jgi:glutathione peroxidase|tara:strand:+ start:48 stop:536 length:489 start_codon:yes stop_codon:yes gene_type:complete
MTKNIYEFTCEDSSGQKIELSSYQGKVLLIVNTASQCGFTPQYEGLEKLQQTFADENFSVLAFPCNQFGGQEPGTNEEITEFCKLNYNNNFPIFSKVDVKGNDAHPLFSFLTKEKKGLMGTENIKWNFTKFLVNKEGEPVSRYAPSTTPDKIQSDIENLLNS